MGDTLECLREFYSSTNGDAWTHNDNWAEGTDPCTFYGAWCNSGNLLGLSLSNNNLSGKLPACLAEMDFMKIDVSNNAIGGELPANIFDNTVFIDLTNTSIAGKLDLSTLKKATDVSLSNTQLQITVSGELPSTAKAIDVSYSNFEMIVDDLLTKIQTSTELEVFSAKHTHLYGQQPTNHQIHSLAR